MDDPDTPVRVHAALALAEMLRHTYGKYPTHPDEDLTHSPRY